MKVRTIGSIREKNTAQPPRAEHVGGHADADDGNEGVGPLVDIEASEEHRRLRWNRDAHALERHQDEDSGEPEVTDDAGRPVGELIGDRREDERRRDQHRSKG